MQVSFELDKITKCAIYNTFSLLSGESVGGVLIRLSLIKQTIKDFNLM